MVAPPQTVACQISKMCNWTHARDSFKRTKSPWLLLNGYIIITVAQSWINFGYTKIASAAVQGEFWLQRLVSHRKKRYSNEVSTHNHVSGINEVRPTKLMVLLTNNTEKGWHDVALDQILAEWDPLWVNYGKMGINIASSRYTKSHKVYLISWPIFKLSCVK